MEIVHETGFAVLKDSEGRVIHKRSGYEAGKSYDVPDELTYEEIEDEETLNAIEVYIEPAPKTYNPSEFLAACIMDSTVVTILDKLDAKQEQRLTTCLQYSNFAMLNGMLAQLESAEVITSADIEYFATKLFTEQNVNLEDYVS